MVSDCMETRFGDRAIVSDDQQWSEIIWKRFSAIGRSLASSAMVSDYMETLFSDRAIVSDRQQWSSIIWKHFSAIGRSLAIVSNGQRLYGNTFQRSGDR